MTGVLAYLRKVRISHFAAKLYPAVVALAVWELGVRISSIRADLLPPPSRVILELWQSRSLLQPAAALTFAAVTAGLGAAAAAGLALGILLAERNRWNSLPGILKIPLLALAPLLLAWFGWEFAPRVVLAFLVALVTITTGTIEGLCSVPRAMQRFLDAASGNRVVARLRVELRAALPTFFRSLRRAAGYSFAAVMAIEFAGAEGGLGHLALEAASKHNMPLLFASLTAMGVFFLLLQLLIKGIERLLTGGRMEFYAASVGSGTVIDLDKLPVKSGEFFSVVSGAGTVRADSSAARVPCEPALPGWLTVMENILLPCRLDGRNRDEGYDRARWLMESFGLSGLEKLRPDSLTPEQAQRVCICRALILSPPLLVMEDPFRILDSVARERLAADLELLWMNSRFTVLLVTGHIEEAVRLSDRVAVWSPSGNEAAEIIDVVIPRPRRMDSGTMPAVMECCSRVRILLRARGLLQ